MSPPIVEPKADSGKRTAHQASKGLDVGRGKPAKNNAVFGGFWRGGRRGGRRHRSFKTLAPPDQTRNPPAYAPEPSAPTHRDFRSRPAKQPNERATAAPLPSPLPPLPPLHVRARRRPSPPSQPHCCSVRRHELKQQQALGVIVAREHAAAVASAPAPAASAAPSRPSPLPLVPRP